jgi:hypothetical protein
MYGIFGFLQPSKLNSPTTNIDFKKAIFVLQEATTFSRPSGKMLSKTN